MADDVRLTFTLPRRLAFSVPAGRHQPCIAGCILKVDRDGQVVITGLSREQTFEQARRFLRIVAKGHGPLSIVAVLTTPARLTYERGGRDGWSIIVGAEIAFTPTTIPPDLGVPELQERAS